MCYTTGTGGQRENARPSRIQTFNGFGSTSVVSVGILKHRLQRFALAGPQDDHLYLYVDKSYGLLFLAGQILSSYSSLLLQTEADIKVNHSFIEKGLTLLKALITPTTTLLSLLTEGPRQSLSPLVIFYVSLVARVPDVALANNLWNAAVEKLSEAQARTQDPDYEFRLAEGLVLFLEQVQID